MPATRRIALLVDLDLGHARNVLSGVREYRESHAPGWILREAPPARTVLRGLRAWRPHGIVAHLYDPALATPLRELGVPVVSVTDTLPEAEFPLVDVDHEQVGRLAARYLLDKGFRSFGFLGSASARFSVAREEALRAALRDAGQELSSFHEDYRPKLRGEARWTRTGRAARRWLERLDKPVAVLCANDVPAFHLAELCREAGLDVPECVAILGVDDDEVLCRLATPPLSSIATPAVQVGREAAARLDRMLRGRSPARRATYLPPSRVVTRGSTETIAVSDPTVRAALEFLASPAGARASVDDVANAARVGRRTLERAFRGSLGRTVLGEVQRLRVERAKSLLLDTDASIEDVARRAGFSGARRMAVVFRRATGVSASAWRADARS